MICVKCRSSKPIVGKAVMLQEDQETTTIEREQGHEGSWEGLPIGLNGMHYMALHVTCFEQFFPQLLRAEAMVACMFYIGDVNDLQEVE